MATSSVLDASKDSHQSTGVCGIFSDYADTASMNGVIFVKSSKRPSVKLMWAILVLAASGAMAFHLSMLIDRYLQFGKQSGLELGFSSLNFPAVTICNTNIMRYSKMKERAPDINQLVNDMLSNKEKLINDHDIGYQNNESSGANTETKNDESKNVSSTPIIEDIFDINATYDYNNTFNSETTPVPSIYLDGEVYGADSWEATAARSMLADATINFKDHFSHLNSSLQLELSHQMDDLLLQCTFATRQCNKTHSTRTTTDYGNCHTIEDKRFISRTSGPNGGLELILYLEPDEYVPIITSSMGAEIVIHGLNSVPLPEDEGISIPSGQETMIGLKQVQINRLGGPYGPCRPVEDFIHKYNVTYTKNLCQKMCLMQKILEKCKCAHAYYKYIYDVMDSKQVKYCSREDYHCILEVQSSFYGEDDDCECFEPCSETVYERTMSLRQWPISPLVDLMVDKVCSKTPLSCQSLKNKTADEIRSFLKLNIYYQDLNYEKLDEAPTYEFTQLLSDVGGTIGLWIGLSILSLFELVHLAIELGHYALSIKNDGIIFSPVVSAFLYMRTIDSKFSGIFLH